MSEQNAFPPAGRQPNFADFLPKRSAGLKLLLVCALALVMTIPALLVHSIVYERSAGFDQAVRDVSESAGGPQNVLGPVLTVPYSFAPNPDKPNNITYGIAVAYAETGAASTRVAVEEKQRGIHTVPVYLAEIEMQAEFSPSALRGAVPQGAEPIWRDARLFVGVSDTRGIKDAIDVTVNGRAVTLGPATNFRTGDGYSVVPNAAVTLAAGRIEDIASLERALQVTVNLKLSGAQRLSIGPFAKDTSLSMVSNWPSPSFSGGVLPGDHDVGESEDGFEASWRVPYLARGIEGAGQNLDLSVVTAQNYRDMGVVFIKEASPYQSVERALKYAAMFIGFVFLAYFLFEVTSRVRAHPAQYILVGLAQAIFYMLLLAFSERIGFDLAFMIAAAMTVGLTSLYATTVFKSRKYGLRAFGILTGIYGLIYVLMRAENHALLAGALASFAAIALTMYMTRNIEWYGDDKSPEPT